MIHFSEKDTRQCEQRGLSLSELEKQIRCLQQSGHAVRVERPAVPGDGIRVLSEEECRDLSQQYVSFSQGKKLLKFVPASGAATRMFKQWFQWADSMSEKEAEQWLQRLPQYPFHALLSERMNEAGLSLEEAVARRDASSVLHFLLHSDGMGFGQMPKGLLPFHVYREEVRTAFEEHWVEGMAYACGSDGVVRMHFTVSPEHEAAFRNLAGVLKKKYENATGKVFEVEFSCQMPCTDTISLNGDGSLHRTEDGKLAFRPGGHGSLLRNLGHTDADVIFVKNIDNVTVDANKADTLRYKQCLGALLLSVQQQSFDLLKRSESGADETLLAAMESLLKKELYVAFPSDYPTFSLEEKVAFCRRKLHRPIRVCGMVKREKEPGGGPFWLCRNGEEATLQIVETSEMDLTDAAQQRALDDSQYFNPVDLVCGLKDYKGQAFDLLQFVDEERYFTAEKSQAGKNIRVLEHPGLWNGSMSDWNTLFVAVPLNTFHPVKTVEDLLRPAHRNA